MSNRVVALCLLMLAFGSAAGAAAVRFHLLPGTQAPAASCPPCTPAVVDCSACGDDAVQPTPTPTQPATPATPATSGALVKICSSEHGTPTLQRLGLSRPGALWAVHCGAGVHVIELEVRDDVAALRRIAHVRMRSSAPELHDVPTAVLDGDLDGDRRNDLLIAFEQHDASDSPRSGGLFAWLRDDAGFARAQKLADGPVRAFALGKQLFIARADDPRLDRPSELVVMRTGPAPSRAASAALGNDVRSVTALDLDLDGIDDLVTTRAGQEAEGVYLTRESGVRERQALALPGAHEALAADLDADGHADVLLAGDTLGYVLAASETRVVHAIAGSERVRDLALLDVDADGRLDVIGHAAHGLSAWLARDGTTFEHRELCSFARARLPFEPLHAQLLHVEASQRAIAVVLGRATESAADYELAVFACDRDATPLGPATALSDAALSLDITLP